MEQIDPSLIPKVDIMSNYNVGDVGVGYLFEPNKDEWIKVEPTRAYTDEDGKGFGIHWSTTLSNGTDALHLIRDLTTDGEWGFNLSRNHEVEEFDTKEKFTMAVESLDPSDIRLLTAFNGTELLQWRVGSSANRSPQFSWVGYLNGVDKAYSLLTLTATDSITSLEGEVKAVVASVTS